MSRVTEILSFVKKDLEQYNQRDVNAAQILFALNKGQEELIMREDLLDVEITIAITAPLVPVTTSAKYPLVYSSGNPVVTQPIIKRIKGVVFPSDWIYPILWRTSQQFDEDMSLEPNLTFPKYMTIRGGNLEVYGSLQPGDSPATLILNCLLARQTQDCSDSYEPEIKGHWDTALRYYADKYLLPITSEGRPILEAMFEAEIKKLSGIDNTKDSFSRSPNCNW